MRKDNIGKALPSKSCSCPMETHVFIKKVRLSMTKSAFVLSKAPRVLALSLKTCQVCGFLSQASGPTLGLAPGVCKFVLGIFVVSDHGSFPYLRKACVFCSITYISDSLTPSFFASVIPLRGLILDFAQCSRASILRRQYGSSI